VEQIMTTLYRISFIASAIMVQGILTKPAFSASGTVESKPPAPIVAAPENQPQPASPQACISIESSATRLECYDTALGRHPEITEAAPQLQVKKARNNPQPTSTTEANLFEVAAPDKIVNPSTSLLDRRWELSPESKLGTFSLRANRPVYILPLFYNDHPNKLPTSANPLNQATTPLNFDDTETKFQLSFKSKLIEGVFGDFGDIRKPPDGKSLTLPTRVRLEKPTTSPKSA
jgi:phospholipase A1